MKRFLTLTFILFSGVVFLVLIVYVLLFSFNIVVVISLAILFCTYLVSVYYFFHLVRPTKNLEFILSRLANLDNSEELFDFIKDFFYYQEGLNVSNITFMLRTFDNSAFEILGTTLRNPPKHYKIKIDNMYFLDHIDKAKVNFFDVKNRSLLPKDIYFSTYRFLKRFSANTCITLVDNRKNIIGFLLFNSKNIEIYEIKHIRDFLSIISTFFKLVRDVKISETMKEDLRIASEIQSKTIPISSVDTDHFEAFGFYRPAYNIGGDYFDILISGSNYAFIISDVSGKGVSAGLVAMILKTMFHSVTFNGNTIQRFVRKVNEYIYKWFSDSDSIVTFLTMFVMVYSPRYRKGYYVNAGHLPVIHYSSKSKTVNLLEVTSRPMGIFKEISPNRKSVQIHTGDILVMYTDGLVEQIDNSGREFGIKRLKSIIEKSALLTPNEIVNEILQSLVSFSSKEMQDDIGILVVKIR